MTHQGMPAGCVTDDTGQTLAVAKAIIADGGKVVPESIGREILNWAENEGTLAEESMILGGPVPGQPWFSLGPECRRRKQVCSVIPTERLCVLAGGNDSSRRY